MTEKSRAFLCVGGPWDGKRHQVDVQHYGFQVPHVRPMSVISFRPDELTAAPVSVEYTVYVAQCLFAHQGIDEVWVWRPSDQKPQDTLHKLLERYEQSANIQWS